MRVGPLEQTLYRSMEQNKPVMITLNNGKVYIGRVLETFMPQVDTTILLLPLKSGYREPRDQSVVITTDYEDLYERIKKDNPKDYVEIIGDFGVVIPIDAVLSFTLYSEEIHARYFARETPTHH